MTGCERLKSMITEGPHKKPLFKIFMYLKTREDMYEKYLNPEKNMDEMYEYIKEQARKQMVDGVAMIEDAVVYGLAIHYFDESNEELGIKKKEVKPRKENKSKEVEKKKTEEIKEVEQDEAIEESPPKEDDNQISLFGGEN